MAVYQLFTFFRSLMPMTVSIISPDNSTIYTTIFEITKIKFSDMLHTLDKKRLIFRLRKSADLKGRSLFV